jgi:long-chain acyl-CoA synthetase
MEKIWYKSYESGIPHTINPNEFASIVSILEHAFSKFPNKPAFHCMGKTYTFKQIEELSRSFAAYLQNDLHFKKGDRIAIMSPNILQYPVALFGSLMAGAIVVNINPLYTARELEYQLKDSGAETIVIVENFAATLAQIIGNTKVKNVITTKLGDFLGAPKSLIVNFVIQYVKKMVPAFNLPNAVSFSKAIASGKDKAYTKQKLSHEDTAFLQYTGGTTGVAKGAVLSHGNVVSNMIQARAWIKNLIDEGEEIIITALPLYHIFSLTANCFVFSSVGALNILITNPRDIPGFVKELKKWKFTTITGVNTLFNALLNNPDFKNLDFSKLKITLGGATAVQKNVAEKWKALTKAPLIEAYGLTETSPAACINPMTLKDYNGFIGLPIPSTEIALLDDDGKEVPLGEVGEISIRGPQVMKGYWNKPEETALVMTNDGFLKTGDMGFMNPQGFIKIVDRKKDMILVSGFNVYPNEIEDVVATMPKVLEVAAIGIPDEKSGEVPKIFVVKKDQSLTEQEILDFCKKNLTGYKVPKAVEFRKDLPKTPVGKILRKQLRVTP